MKVLLLGGTGAIGRNLASILSNQNDDVYVTSRQNLLSTDRIKYICGNAKDISFVTNLCHDGDWDAIVDFMIYSTTEFAERINILLNGTKQYFFLSSARVYADTDIICENSPRLLDVSTDAKFLSTDEYSLKKARQENILYENNLRNWVIIRPYITYDTYRLQLGTLEKEQWLYRAIHGRKILFSKDVASKYTTLTYGKDVSRVIANMVGNKHVNGETFHITGISIKWEEVADIYKKTLSDFLNRNVDIILTENSIEQKGLDYYHLCYDRTYNRIFDNSKISKYIDVNTFVNPSEGLKKCLLEFLNNPVFKDIYWYDESQRDRITRECAKYGEFNSLKDYFLYLYHRYK